MQTPSGMSEHHYTEYICTGLVVGGVSVCLYSHLLAIASLNRIQNPGELTLIKELGSELVGPWV